MRLRDFMVAGLVIFGIGIGLSFQNIFQEPSQIFTGGNSDLKPDNKLFKDNKEPSIATPDLITSDNKPQKDLDSIPFRYLPWSAQLKQSQPYHEYGAVTLKRYDPEPTHYATENAEQGYMVIENYPGVLHYRYLPFQGELKRPYNCFRLEFYNPASKVLIKRVNLIDSSPYNNDRYPILGFGFPAEEDFNWDQWAAIYPDGPQAFYERLNHNEKCYLTVNNVNAQPNGYTTVEYQLIEMSRAGGPLGWEETLAIYDNLGNQISTYTTNHDIVATWVSDDGRFLAYVYGGPDSSNPQDYNQGGFNIYDLQKNEIVYKKSNKEEQVMFSRIGMDNLNYLDIPASEMVSVGIHSPDSDVNRVIFLIDFNNRSVYKTKVDKAPYLPLRTKPADSLLKQLPFTREPFSHTGLGNSTLPRDFFRTGPYIQEPNRMGVTKLEFVDERTGIVNKEAVDYEANRKWHEYFPGVLQVENFRPPHHTALQFYNKDGVLQKTLSLEALNPFLNRIDKPISKGAYNFEVHEPAPDSMLTNIPEPDRFLTIFYDARTDPHNGNTVANYGLTAIHKNFVLYIKSASVIISPDGNVLNTLILDDAASAVLTSNDGTLIVYTYGGYLNNPLTSVTKQECRVYDFNRGKEVLKVQADTPYQILGVPVVGEDLKMAKIAYKNTDIDNSHYRLDLLDLNTRQRYTRDFQDNSFARTWNQNNSYRQIIQNEFDAFEVDSF